MSNPYYYSDYHDTMNTQSAKYTILCKKRRLLLLTKYYLYSIFIDTNKEFILKQVINH